MFNLIRSNDKNEKYFMLDSNLHLEQIGLLSRLFLYSDKNTYSIEEMFNFDEEEFVGEIINSLMDLKYITYSRETDSYNVYDTHM